MKVAMIVAMDANNAIGANNQLPWHIPEDLKRFKAITMGKSIIMGRKTYDSIGRPLPGRTNIVITRQPDWHHHGVVTAADLAQALEIARQHRAAEQEVIIIGGEQIYRLALDRCQRIYLTRVNTSVEGDAFFPALDKSAWQQVAIEQGFSEKEGLGFSFEILERV
jgi:dihydrofolate reductase